MNLPAPQLEVEKSVKMLMYVWEFKQELLRLTPLSGEWDKLEFVDPEGNVITDQEWASVYLREGNTYEIRGKDNGLSPVDRAHLFRVKHSGGRWGQNLADAEINENWSYAIVNLYEHEIDYMFSQSVDDDYWIYDLRTMQEFKTSHDLSYRFFQDSSGIREKGIDSVKFNPENPMEILVSYSNQYGAEKETLAIPLP